jgi:enoyl-CoA hydratase
VLTASTFDARQAEAWGMVNEVVAEGGALGRSLALADEIVKAAPMSIRYAKLAMQRGSEVDFHTGYALDIAAYDVLVGTEDRREGIAAFNEKRTPRWKGQ